MDERSDLRVHGRAARRPDPHTRARAQSRCPGRSARRGSCSRQVETDERCPVFFFFPFSFLLNVSSRQPLEELSSHTPIPHPPPPPTPRLSSASHYSLCFPCFPRRSAARHVHAGVSAPRGCRDPERRWDPARAGGILARKKTAKQLCFAHSFYQTGEALEGVCPGPRFIAAC